MLALPKLHRHPTPDQGQEGVIHPPGGDGRDGLQEGPLHRIGVEAEHLCAGGGAEDQRVAGENVGGGVLVAAGKAADAGGFVVEGHREEPPARTDRGLGGADGDDLPFLPGDRGGVCLASDHAEQGEQAQECNDPSLRSGWFTTRSARSDTEIHGGNALWSQGELLSGTTTIAVLRASSCSFVPSVSRMIPSEARAPATTAPGRGGRAGKGTAPPS